MMTFFHQGTLQHQHQCHIPSPSSLPTVLPRSTPLDLPAPYWTLYPQSESDGSGDFPPTLYDYDRDSDWD